MTPLACLLPNHVVSLQKQRYQLSSRWFPISIGQIDARETPMRMQKSSAPLHIDQSFDQSFRDPDAHEEILRRPRRNDSVSSWSKLRNSPLSAVGICGYAAPYHILQCNTSLILLTAPNRKSHGDNIPEDAGRLTYPLRIFSHLLSGD